MTSKTQDAASHLSHAQVDEPFDHCHGSTSQRCQRWTRARCVSPRVGQVLQVTGTSRSTLRRRRNGIADDLLETCSRAMFCEDEEQTKLHQTTSNYLVAINSTYFIIFPHNFTKNSALWMRGEVAYITPVFFVRSTSQSPMLIEDL